MAEFGAGQRCPDRLLLADSVSIGAATWADAVAVILIEPALFFVSAFETFSAASALEISERIATFAVKGERDIRAHEEVSGFAVLEVGTKLMGVIAPSGRDAFNLD